MATKNVILKDSSSNELRPETSITQVKDNSGNDLFTQESGVVSTTSGNSINGASIHDASIGVGKFETTVQNGVNLAISEWEKGLNLFSFDIVYDESIHGTLVSKSSNSFTMDGSTQYSHIAGKLQLEANTTYTLSMSTTNHQKNITTVCDGTTTEHYDTQHTFTTGTSGVVVFTLYATLNDVISGNVTISNIMLNEGDHAYPYQEYKGEIARVSDLPTKLSQLSGDSTHRIVTDTEKDTWDSKYDKPSGGIPKTDLTSEVQASLGKADNSVQPETGKGLSSNDFTNTYKDNVDNNTSARHTHSNKAVLDGITSTDISVWNHKVDKSSSDDIQIYHAGDYHGNSRNSIIDLKDSTLELNIIHETDDNQIKNEVILNKDGFQINDSDYSENTPLFKVTPTELKYKNLNLATTNDLPGQATASTAGLVKIGATTSGKDYPVKLNSNGQMYVSVNWDADSNSWRKVQLNGVDKLGTGTNTNPLNIKAGTNVSITESSGTFTFSATDTTYSNKTAVSGGTEVSLVTTGEKYAWNNKLSSITSAMVTTALGYTPPTADTNYYHTPSYSSGLKIATGTGKADLYVPMGTTASSVCAGNDSRLSDSRPANDVYPWAKASSKPSYSYNEISGKPTIPTYYLHTIYTTWSNISYKEVNISWISSSNTKLSVNKERLNNSRYDDLFTQRRIISIMYINSDPDGGFASCGYGYDEAAEMYIAYGGPEGQHWIGLNECIITGEDVRQL